MILRNAHLGQTLLDVGRHGFQLRRSPIDPTTLQHLLVPGWDGPDVLPAELSDRLRQHRGAVLALLARGYNPMDAKVSALLDDRLLAWGAAGLPDDGIDKGGHGWLVMAGECLDGIWPKN